MIYIIEKMDEIHHDDLNASSSENLMIRLLPLLSNERKEKALSYRFYEDKLRSAAVYVLLSYGMKKEYRVDELPEFRYGSIGKPYLKDEGNIYFSFSHSKGVAACMIDTTEAGIDVQERFTFEQGIVDQICSGNEKALFDKTKDKDKDRLLNRLWVLKEAYTKYLGTGITISIEKLDFSKEVFLDTFKIMRTVFEEKECFLRIVEKEAYCMAVCSNQEEHKLVYVTIEELIGSLIT